MPLGGHNVVEATPRLTVPWKLKESAPDTPAQHSVKHLIPTTPNSSSRGLDGISFLRDYINSVQDYGYSMTGSLFSARPLLANMQETSEDDWSFPESGRPISILSTPRGLTAIRRNSKSDYLSTPTRCTPRDAPASPCSPCSDFVAAVQDQGLPLANVLLLAKPWLEAGPFLESRQEADNPEFEADVSPEVETGNLLEPAVDVENQTTNEQGIYVSRYVGVEGGQGTMERIGRGGSIVRKPDSYDEKRPPEEILKSRSNELTAMQEMTDGLLPH